MFDYSAYVLDDDTIWVDRAAGGFSMPGFHFFSAWLPFGVKSYVYSPLAKRAMEVETGQLDDLEKDILENPTLGFLNKINLLENSFRHHPELQAKKMPKWLEKLERLRQWELKHKLLKLRKTK